MKLKSNPNNQIILTAHNRRVRHNGYTYIVRAQKLGSSILADAEIMPNKNNTPLVNLFDRSQLSKELRSLVEHGLVS
jgi:hypothetical protein